MSDLNISKVRTRFAPSPTGYIHLGNIRTAFFCWLFAKKHGGEFFLRIDDTDKKRCLKKYTNNILDILHWLNLNYTGNPTFQSERYVIYRSYLEKLLVSKKAYKCYCTKDRLDNLKKSQMFNKSRIMYDGFCKDIVEFKEKKFVIRFISDQDGYTEFDDLIRGNIRIANKEVDDFIISKDNYMPTYNFASSVDDIDFNITHVIRGEDHISNTQKQIMIIKSFDKKIPYFAHLPMILDSNKKKISKRDNSIYMDYYKYNGFLPIAVLNYIVRLGWSYKNEEVFSLEEMVNLFDLNNVNKSASCINFDKLLWLNRYYLQKMQLRDLIYFMIPVLKKFNFNYSRGPSFSSLLEFGRHKFHTLYEIFDKNSYFYFDQCIFSNNDFLQVFSIKSLDLIKLFYFDLKDGKYAWTIINIKIHIDFFLKEYSIDFSDFAMPLRFIITGNSLSNPLYELIFLCGKILLLKKIINTIKQMGL